MVQREREVPVSGTATPGSEVRVFWKGKEFRASADTEGRWRTQVPSGPASAVPEVLRVESGSETLEARDLLVGEVWLASGQSNMQWSLEECGPGPWAAPDNLAPDPLLRVITIPWNPAAKPQTGILETRWRSYDPESALKASAVAQFFGQELRRQLGIPVGIISSAVGGSPIEAWIPEEVLRPMPEARACFAQAAEYQARYPQLLQEDEERKRAWEGRGCREQSRGPAATAACALVGAETRAGLARTGLLLERNGQPATSLCDPRRALVSRRTQCVAPGRLSGSA